MSAVVSIICNTFNHEKYIAQTLDSFLMQKTDFPIEILIHDDASTDGTADIIRKYAEKYPDTIFPIYQKENQYSKNINITTTFQYPRVKGKYIAFCEGDDYWLDSFKLQKQFEMLEKNPDINMCAHAAVVTVDEKPYSTIEPKNEDGILTVDEVIRGGGNWISTNSLFYRNSIIKNKMDFIKKCHMDYTLQIFGALDEGILYLHDKMSVYRRATGSSWTVSMRKNPEKMEQHIRIMMDTLKELNRETNEKYEQSITYAITKYEFQLVRHKGGLQCLNSQYRIFYNEMSGKEKFILMMQALAPWMLTAYGRVKDQKNKKGKDE